MRSLALALLLVPALAFGQAIPPESGGGGSGVAEDLLTAEMDTTKHLVPDGAGGAEWLVPAAAAPAGHNTSHENGGADEIDVTGLVGLPAAYDGGSVTNPFLAPTGCTNPGFSFTDSPTAGLCKEADSAGAPPGNFQRYRLYRAATPNGVAGYQFGIYTTDTGTTRTYMEFKDPDATSQTSNAFQVQSSSTTSTTQLALRQFNLNTTAFNVSYSVGGTTTMTLTGAAGGAGTSPAIKFENSGYFATSLVAGANIGAARTITLPDASGDVALLPAAGASTFALATTLVTNEVDVANSVWGASNGLVFEGATGGADTFETTLTLVDPTGDNTITLQNATGTVALTSDLYDGGAFSPSADDTSSNGSVASKWQNVYVTRSIQGSKSKALVDATATAFVRVAIPQTIATNYKGGEIIYEIYCDDDTNQASQSGTVKFTCHNLAGAEACGFSTPDGVTLGDGTANLVAPVFTAATAAADTIDLQVDSNCTGIAPNTHTIEYRLDMPTTATLTPQ